MYFITSRIVKQTGIHKRFQIVGQGSFKNDGVCYDIISVKKRIRLDVCDIGRNDKRINDAFESGQNSVFDPFDCFG